MMCAIISFARFNQLYFLPSHLDNEVVAFRDVQVSEDDIDFGGPSIGIILGFFLMQFKFRHTQCCSLGKTWGRTQIQT